MGWVSYGYVSADVRYVKTFINMEVKYVKRRVRRNSCQSELPSVILLPLFGSEIENNFAKRAKERRATDVGVIFLFFWYRGNREQNSFALCSRNIRW